MFYDMALQIAGFSQGCRLPLFMFRFSRLFTQKRGASLAGPMQAGDPWAIGSVGGAAWGWERRRAHAALR